MKSKISIILVFALIAAIFIASICFSVNSYYHIETHTVKVEGKERITKQNGGNAIKSFYVVYTDKGTFKLEDDMLRGNYYSSDVYGKLKENSTYTFKTSGYRIGWASEYPNIIEVKQQDK
jgi:hypothetical protein